MTVPTRASGPRRMTRALLVAAVAAVVAVVIPRDDSVTPPGASADPASAIAGIAVRDDATFPSPGSEAPDLALPYLHREAPFVRGDSLRLTELAGRYVYLDVFGSWCLPCRQKYPEMTEIARELEEMGAVMLGVLYEDRPEDAAAFFAANGGQAYPFVVADDETARQWALTGAPMGFLVSPEGRIERMCLGCERGSARVETLPEAGREGLARRYRNGMGP